MSKVWVGIDIGKEHHWAVGVDGEGRKVLSRRVFNDESDILGLLAEVAALDAETAVWAVDLVTGESALLLAVLWERGHSVRYLPGKAVNRAAAGYRSEGKTDAKDALVIADQARMRRDLAELRPADELVHELRLLTARRTDLVADRTRAIVRLRQHLTGICPALERAADLTQQRGWAILLTRYQRPQVICRAGTTRLAKALKDMGIRSDLAERIASAAVTAARSQSTRLAGEQVAADIVAGLAKDVISLDQQISDLDTAIQARFRCHPQAEVILSMPGMGFRLGAEFLAAIGDLSWFASADQLAAYAGLAPVANDSGKRSGNMRKPQRYNRSLRRVFYLSALTSIRCCPTARAYFDKKRAEGKRAKPAIIALARRRADVLWALLRDNRSWEPNPPTANVALSA